jgi:hypothetical protein
MSPAHTLRGSRFASRANKRIRRLQCRQPENRIEILEKHSRKALLARLSLSGPPTHIK